MLLIRCCLAVVLLAVQPGVASSGGGPEHVFLVVNSHSWASLTVANHYIALRRIPSANVLHLDWRGDNELTDVGTFRNRILGPVLEAINRRGLSRQIAYIIYSSDFPWSIDFRADLETQQVPPQLASIGSLTGMTFLYQMTMQVDPRLLNLQANHYYRQSSGDAPPSSHGFRGWYGWSKEGELLEAGGSQFMLSTMLAVTSGRGTSVSEAVSGLIGSAAADGTRPDGTIYYVKNVNVRSTTRDPGFDAAVAALTAEGVKAEVLEGQIPIDKADVQGAMLGTSDFDWASSSSTIRPGAICEHLTSFGGVMVADFSQTPLSELLRFGAAGASGAVFEPYSIQAKFPNPWIQLHYVRGCSLAEAYYQSVHGPYQLLIVGDPLCQPWAIFPKLEVTGISPGNVIRSDAKPIPMAGADSTPSAQTCEWFLDGILQGEHPIGEELPLASAKLPDGHHELRFVASTDDAIATQGRAVLPFSTDNRGHSVVLTASDSENVRWNKTLTLSAVAPWADGVVFLQNQRPLGSVILAGGRAELALDPQTLGQGPVTVQALAFGIESPLGAVVSSPLLLNVQSQEPQQPTMLAEDAELEAGLRLTRPDGTRVVVPTTRSSDWLAEAGIPPGEGFRLSAVFEAPQTDTWQFQVKHVGPLWIQVDRTVLYESPGGDGATEYLPIPLAAGRHRLEIRGREPGGPPDLRFGGPAIRPLDGETFRHVP